MPAPMVANERMEVVRVRERLPKAFIKSKEFREETFICVKREMIREVIQLLKDDPDLQYDYFVECLGVDYSRWEHDRDLDERFEVVYNLYSLKHSSRIFVKIGVNDGQKVPTLKHVFLGAEYPEKEIADLYGVLFEGNELPAGERFLLADDWLGFPLRKEYPLGGEDVLFAQGEYGPAVEDVSMPHAGESFEGKTGSEDVSGR
ncbi:MAG: NADH-quinone oxidoreductase subunit [Fimbriimonadaceae bacterium]|jgi:NADH-quinone oxidoreductase subunit C|nr:NADH-quinone oxidoreductase subunit [Fimbriimonadaceae bacterium]